MEYLWSGAYVMLLFQCKRRSQACKRVKMCGQLAMGYKIIGTNGFLIYSAEFFSN
jgi:hypothetical protein